MQHSAVKMICNTVHYILEVDGKLQKFSEVLHYITVNNGQTGSLIASVSKARLEMDLSETTIIATAVTDGGSNYSRAACILTSEDDSYHCVAHRLSLVIKDSISADREVERDMAAIQVILKLILLTYLEISCRILYVI